MKPILSCLLIGINMLKNIIKTLKHNGGHKKPCVSKYSNSVGSYTMCVNKHFNGKYYVLVNIKGHSFRVKEQIASHEEALAICKRL